MSLTSLSALASVSGFVKGNPSIDYYKVLGFSPELVADFDDEYYRANRQKTTFDGLLTHSRLSNATMVDSDGLLKWAPHNLVLRSEEFDLSPWGLATQGSGVLPTITPDYALAPDGVSLATRLQCSRASAGAGDRSRLEQILPSTNYAPIGAQLTRGIWVKSTDGSNQVIQITDSSEANSVNTVTVGSDWVFVTITYPVLLSNSGNFWVGLVSANTSALTTDVLIWGAHLYRSDLGGMVNNPDTGNSYVPTTSSARYLPRRGHHVWNGSAWVNEGLLIETEARTNLLHTTNALVTQTLTVTAVPHTLHFTGTGTVTLSGASTDGPLVGTGTGEQNRVSLTFTPTAGSLTLTVTGTVADAQLEVGSTPSSYIPNLAASGSVNRTPDILTIPSAKLPWPTPRVIGPELVTNGGFATDITGWTDISESGGSIAWNASGYIDLTTGASSTYEGRAEQVITTVIGKTYVLQITRASGASMVNVGTSTKGQQLVTTAVDASAAFETLTFTATTTTTYIGLRNFFDFNATSSIDNISVREIDPLSVSIQMDGRMTYADEGTDSTVFFVRWIDDSNNFIYARLRTDGSYTGSPQILQRALGAAAAQPTPESTPGSYSPGILVPYNIASRHGSTFINGSVDGTSLNADLTPVALPDLSSTNLSLAYDYMGCIRQFRVWAADLGDSGIEEASEGEPSSYLIWDASADTYIQKVYD